LQIFYLLSILNLLRKRIYMKRSVIAVSVIMVTAALIGSGCKKNRSSSQENSSVSTSGSNSGSNNFSGSQGSSSAMNQVPAGTNGAVGTNTGSNANTATGNTAGAANGNGNATGVTNGTGSTASGSAPSNANGAPQALQATEVAKAPEAPKEIPVTCFVETFKHKPTPGHDSEEACSHHKNLLKLSHSDINMKNVCVRVNDVPVKFERAGKGDELLIGSIAGPQATITVKYCTGKTSCADAKKNDCVIPKDEFLDAIGGGDPDDGSVAKWDNGDGAADAKLNNDVKRELADIDDTATDNHGANASIFKDWIAEKPAPACAVDKKHSS
jgi:hypothetical protein